MNPLTFPKINFKKFRFGIQASILCVNMEVEGFFYKKKKKKT